MQQYQILMWWLKATWVLFIFAYGACLGSLTNVIVYRMPKGLSIVRPPSRCPKCETRLSWRDNIPVLGWIFLRGKCRYCKTRISPEYPLVEAAMGLLFVLFFAIWYLIPAGAGFAGIDFSAMTPRWAAWNDPYKTWPEFAVLLVLVGALFAMTLVDAKTFTIPIQLTWVPAIVAVLVHPIHAGWLGWLGARPQTDWWWAIPTPGPNRWDLVGMSIGAMLGLGIGLLLIYFGLIGRSFADYAEWEAKAKAAEAAAGGDQTGPSGEHSTAMPVLPGQEFQVASTVLEPAGPSSALQTPAADQPSAQPAESNPAMWMAYPHARREMIRELAFLGPCLCLGLAGFYAGRHWGGVYINPDTGFYASTCGMAPLWLTALSGVLLGYLVGGAVVWFVRIFGSLAFGKEAMGMGDVHVMAAVGACLGWIDAVLGFLGAAFVGLAWAVLGRLAGGGFKRVLPYGPFLAVSTMLVLLCKPLIEKGLSLLLSTPIHIP